MAEGVRIIITSSTGEAVAGVERTTASLEQLSVAANKAAASMERSGVATSAAAKRSATTSVASAATVATRWESAGKRMERVGHSMTRNVTLPIVALGGVAIKSSLDFHRAMTLVQTQAGASAKEVDRMSKAILRFAASGQTDQGPKALADGLYAIESAGIRGSRAMRTLKASSDLAMIGQANLADTTKALVAAQKTGIAGSRNLRHEIGTLNATVGAGQMHMEDLLSAMGTGFLTSAHQVGLNLSDVGAALAELTKQGIPASAAATRLRMTFTLMAAPTDKAKAALAGIGLGASDLARTMRTQGLIPALELLHKHLQDLSKVQQTQVLSEAFGGARSGTTIMALVNNLGDLDKTLGSVHKHSGEVNKSLGAAKHTSAEELKIAWAQAQAALVKFGDALIPVVIPALQDVAGVVEHVASGFQGLPKWLQGDIVKFGLLVAAIGPAISVIGKLTRAMGFLVGVDLEAKLAGDAAATGGFTSKIGRVVGLLTGVGLAAEAAKGPIEQLDNSLRGGSVQQQWVNSWTRALQDQINAARNMGRNDRVVLEARIRMWQRSGFITEQQAKRTIGSIKEITHAERALQGTQRAYGIAGALKRQGDLTAPIVLQIKHQLGTLPPYARQQASNLLVGLTRVMENKGDLPVGATRRLRTTINAEWPKITLKASRESAKTAQNVTHNIGILAQALGSAYNIIVGNTNQALKAFNANPVKFVAKAAKEVGTVAGLFGLQEGGMLVPGSGSGDKVPLHIAGRLAAMVEPGELVSVMNRNATDTLMAINGMVPRFQQGGVAHLASGGVPRVGIAGSGMPNFRQAGQNASDEVRHAALAYLKAHRPTRGGGGILHGSGDVAAAFADAVRHYRAPYTPALALFEAGFAESGMQDLSYGDSSSQGALQLLASTAAGLGVSPHDELAIASLFLTRGFFGHGGALSLYAGGNTDAASIAHLVQGNATGTGVYSAQSSNARRAMQEQGLRYRGETLKMQRGGIVPGLAGGGYVWPFGHASVSRTPGGTGWSRIDQGVDFYGTGPIQAIGDARILKTGAPGWPEGGGVLYKLLNGPKAGKDIYVYEGVKAMAGAGQRVDAGKVLAKFQGSSIEMGFADDAGVPIGHGGYVEGKAMPAGKEMYGWLKSLAAGGGWKGGGGGGGGGSTGPTPAQQAARQRKAKALKLRKQRENHLASLMSVLRSTQSPDNRLFAMQEIADFWGSYGIFDKDERKHIASLHARVAKATASPGTSDDLSAMKALIDYEAKHGTVSGAPNAQIAKRESRRRLHHRQAVLAGLTKSVRSAQGGAAKLAAFKKLQAFWDHWGVFSGKEQQHIAQLKKTVTQAALTPGLHDDLAAYRDLTSFEKTFGKISAKAPKAPGSPDTTPDTTDTGAADTGPDLSQLLALEEDLNRTLAQNLSVSQAQYQVFRQFLGQSYIGAFDMGGVVPGPAGRPYLATVHGGEVIGQPGNVNVYVSGSVEPLIDVAVSRSVDASNRAIGRTQRIQSFAPGG